MSTLSLTETAVEPIEIRRKRLIFRAWHRGTREMDLLLGTFADRHVPGFDAAQLQEFEQLLECPDPDLYDWYTGKAVPNGGQVSSVLEMFLQHKYI